MNITLTGEQLGIDDEELLSVEFNVELDDDDLEDDHIQIEGVSSDSDDVFHLVDSEYAKQFIRPILSVMKDDKMIEMQAMQRDIDL